MLRCKLMMGGLLLSLGELVACGDAEGGGGLGGAGGAERYEAQLGQACTGSGRLQTGTCGWYQAWICTGTPGKRCLYDQAGEPVHWQ